MAKLTDRAIRTAKPAEKPVRLFDGGGLYIEVQPTGSRLWRYKYRYDEKEKRLALGAYPEIGLKEARERHAEARKLIAQGIDPSAHKKALKRATGGADSFEAVAREFIDKQSGAWAASHTIKIVQRLERDVFPWLGSAPVAEVNAPMILPVVRRIEERGAKDTAHRAMQNIGQVMRYAVATGRADRDPTGDLRGALAPARGGHMAATLEPAAFARLLIAMDEIEAVSYEVKAALRLTPLVFVRPAELRRARWADIDLEAAEWRYHVTKTNQDHIVPLSRQALAILKDLHPLTGAGEWVFPSPQSVTRPISDGALRVAMRRAGIAKEETTMHGFRATARTLLDEALGYAPHLIEHQLAHAVRDPLGRAYNRTSHLPERKKMMQAWSDYLDTLKAGAQVIPIGQVGGGHDRR